MFFSFYLRITGGELFERVIDDDFILTERLCELYMMQICEGVNFMHSCNIIHLDMKVGNEQTKCEFMMNLCFCLAGKYFMFESRWSSNKNHRFWFGKKIRSDQTIESSLRYAGVRCTGSDQFRSSWIRHRYVVGWSYLLCFVNIFSFVFFMRKSFSNKTL